MPMSDHFAGANAVKATSNQAPDVGPSSVAGRLEFIGSILLDVRGRLQAMNERVHGPRPAQMAPMAPDKPSYQVNGLVADANIRRGVIYAASALSELASELSKELASLEEVL